ncbi:prepilin-type N-terminal cleavage/methylation domain-containing protein [Cupriavidus basilensis]|uniref:Prepilin-type N-terminal cleavage/methylation domain-containing protein n=1 Tax=Cupriavidus basilensis TaxID=68895 RepID=A0ABT6ALV6_9BURK|nr:prepilin-type N-terminal cleavage/methylation domain-containing protein [Cupriavidus basilensis]MDF3833595.1 prepilin-type N-terminal cleavage/methylation domain-containing protein [Cupriavidus basilensis]
MKPRVQGFALIEALVSLTLFSVGIVGLCAATLLAAKQNSQTRYRTVAQYYAAEIIGVASVDAANAACYTVPAGGGCTAGTGQAIATDWLKRVKGALPSDDQHAPSVVYDAITGNLTVTLQWKLAGEAQEKTYLSLTTWHNAVTTTNLK